MVSIETVKQMALSFPETDEHPHFQRTAYRVKKKIFATLLESDHSVNLKLSLEDQSVFCSFDSAVIRPVEGGWGRMGFTYVNLKKVRKAMLKDALTMAYCRTAPAKLAEKFLPK